MGTVVRDVLKERDEMNKTEGMLEALRKVMEKMKIPAEQAMEFLDIPKSDYDKYLPLL